MSMKKELKKIYGTGESMEKRSIRTGLSAIELNQHDERFNKITYHEKQKGYWPETSDMRIRGRK